MDLTADSVPQQSEKPTPSGNTTKLVRSMVIRRRSRINLTRSSKTRAVSLIEMLVVISIMSLLMSIMLPSFNRAREQARRTICVANLKQIGAGVFSYALDHKDHGPSIMDPLGTTAPRSLLSRAGKYVNLGLLRKSGILSDSSTFYCPSQNEFAYGSDPALMPAATVAGSYAYSVHIPARKSPVMGAIRHLAIASDDYSARLGASAGNGKGSHRVGYNVLYTDGSASWYTDADESIWKRRIHWDDETDDVTYQTLYQPSAPVSDDQYGDEMDIFRVWRAFCYNQRVEFPPPTP